MVKAFDIPKYYLYRYLQVQSLVKIVAKKSSQNCNTLSTTPPHGWIEDILDLSVSERGLISTVYSLIQTVVSPSLD